MDAALGPMSPVPGKSSDIGPLLSDPALAATTRGPVYLLIISSSIVCLSFDTLWCPWGNCIVSRMTPMTKVLRSTPRTCCPYI